MTGVESTSAPARFDPVTRMVHWLTVPLVVVVIPVGWLLANGRGDAELLTVLHETVGVVVLALAVVRIVNVVLRRGPGPYPRLGRLERIAAVGSEYLMYALVLAQPLIGWAMVSALGARPRLPGGLELPALLPTDPDRYPMLRTLHTWFGYALLLVFTAHIVAVLVHRLVLRDGLLDRMLFERKRRTPAARR